MKTGVQIMIGALALFISLSAFTWVAGALSDNALGLNKELPSNMFTGYLKDYDGTLVFEFAYTGDLDTKKAELKSIPAEDLKIITLAPGNQKTTFEFKDGKLIKTNPDGSKDESDFEKTIEPIKIYQIKVPKETINAAMTYKGELV